MSSINNINIERTVLSSILFNHEEIAEVKKILTPKDFYLPAHEKIYSVMLSLYDELMPIDEEFIRKKLGNEFDENILIDILSSNPITNTEAYVNEIKESSVKRKLMSLTSEIKKLVDDDNTSSIKILSDLEYKIQSLTKSRKDNFLKAKPLSLIEEEDTKYICKNYIPFPSYSVGLIAAKGGIGKTFAALNICEAFIKEKFEEEGIYPKTLIIATEDRAGKLKSRAKMLGLKHLDYITISSIYSFDVLEKDYKTQNWRLTEDFYKFKNESSEYGLIIIDPMLSFYSGKENDNGDAKKFMMPFVRLADERKQNIIFLHHSDKEGKGSRGAGAFADATRLTYFVSKETMQDEDEKTWIEVPHSRKLRFEIQKQNDDISSVKKLDSFVSVSNVGSFLVDVFPLKVEMQSFEPSIKKDNIKKTTSKQTIKKENKVKKEELGKEEKSNIDDFSNLMKTIEFE